MLTARRLSGQRRQRNPVERFFNRIKYYRSIATQYDKNPAIFLAAVKLIALRILMPVGSVWFWMY